MRAIAALAVFFLHATYEGYFPGNLITRIFAQGAVGVPIFFVISGFLLYRPFVLARLGEAPRPSLKRYFLRRCTRILPAYWVALTIFGIFSVHKEMFSPLRNFLIFYFLGQGWWREYGLGGLSVAWSLSVEFAFYILLIGIILAMAGSGGRSLNERYRREIFGLGLIFVGSIFYQLMLINPRDIDQGAPVGWVFGWLDFFSLGMMVAALSAYIELGGREPQFVTLARRWPAAYFIVAAVAYLASCFALGIKYPDVFTNFTPLNFTLRQSLWAVVSVSLLLGSIFAYPAGHVIGRFLSSRPVIFFGLISYGIFLWHWPVIKALIKIYDHFDITITSKDSLFLWLLNSFVLTTLCAWLSWRLVEEPSSRLLDRWMRKKKNLSADQG